MNYQEFVSIIVNQGIAAAIADYTDPKDKNKLEGSIAGFKACENKSPEELKTVWAEAQEYLKDRSNHEQYWWFRCYILEVEWVCNVVSATLHNEGAPPILSWLPTVNGMMKAASILGIKQE